MRLVRRLRTLKVTGRPRSPRGPRPRTDRTCVRTADWRSESRGGSARERRSQRRTLNARGPSALGFWLARSRGPSRRPWRARARPNRPGGRRGDEATPSRERGEARLREVAVKGERLLDAEVPHHHEARAVRETPPLVPVVLKLLEGILAVLRIDADHGPLRRAR